MGTEVVRMAACPSAPRGLRQAELAANRIVWQDVPVLVSYPHPRRNCRPCLPLKKRLRAGAHRDHPGRGRLRLLRHHTRTTGQVGQIKILASEEFQGGVRLSVVCGPVHWRRRGHARPTGGDPGTAFCQGRPDCCGGASVYDEYNRTQVYTLDYFAASCLTPLR